MTSAALTLHDLIARLEVATEGSLELDYAIYRAVNDFARNWLPDHPPGRLPEFTRLLDAALTLVPDGMDWSVVRRTRRPYRGKYNFEAVVWNVPTQGFAQSGPIALCIAALKART